MNSEFRAHVAQLGATDDLLSLETAVHTVDEVATVACEALRRNGPAVRFESTPGAVGLISGAYAGPDQLRRRTRKPWTRLALALGEHDECTYTDLLRRINRLRTSTPVEENPREQRAATPSELTLGDLGFPVLPTGDAPVVTLGIMSVQTDGVTSWWPVRGLVNGPHRIRVSIPQLPAEALEERTPVSIAFGVPAAALIGGYLPWLKSVRQRDPFPPTAVPDDVPVAETVGGLLPASAELVIEGIVGGAAEPLGEPLAGWERLSDCGQATVDVDQVLCREESIVPFVPLGAPLSDDIHIAGVLEASKLYERVNNYWGVSPMKWLAILPEARLGLCIVSSEILYAGFEWQLANALFTFSDSFDKVLILDSDVEPMALGRALADLWVKAHPSHDWTFSDDDAPAATAPLYRRDGSTGKRLYINATWDPSWEAEYIAPKVSFENSYPEELKAEIRRSWDSFGFTAPE
ncbi:UbiD family decarboxylase [Natronobeatus ordinarius]|uniref:UbiD family decarboxylase n=1 Tax=Natronobeatus ordinarius TaxID=2963433 RepID=UPI0020CEA086|nr:UbiD family decarboxylase [Natronobeatus ordinarius]